MAKLQLQQPALPSKNQRKFYKSEICLQTQKLFTA